MWRVRRPAGGPVTGTGSLRGSSFRLPCKRTTASSRLTSLRPPLAARAPLGVALLSLCLFLFPALSLPLSLSSSPYPALRVRLSPPPANSPLTSFSIRPGARLRTPLSSPLVRPAGRSVDRPLLSLRRHPPRLLSSFARKRCHTRETAHRLFVLRCCPPPRRGMLSLAPFRHSRAQQRLSRSVFHPFPLSVSLFLLTSRSRGHDAYSLLHSSLSPRPTSAGCLAAVVVVLFFFFFVPRSSFNDRAGDTSTGGHATIYPTRRRGQSAGRNDGTRR